MKNFLKKAAIVGMSSLALGGVVSVGTQSATPAPAEAAVIAYRVSPSSEKPMRLCSAKNGRACREFKQGSYAVGVASFRQDSGCEYWAGGQRKFKRVTKATYRNYDDTVSKVTGALRNCRTTNRGDVAPGK